MKRLSGILLLCALGLLTGCWEKQVRSNPNEPLLRYHFAGMKAALKGTNGTRLQKVWGMPDTMALREEAMTKLASAPHHILKRSLPPGAPDEAAMIKPLLLDLVDSEHFVHAKTTADKVEFVVGVKLSDDRAKVWDGNLQKIAADWKLAKEQSGAAGLTAGWQAKGAAGQVAFMRASGWTLLGFGTTPKLSLLAEFAGNAAKPAPAGDLGGALLDLSADLPRLRKWVPLFAEYPLPPAHIKIEGRGENLRTELKFLYSENLRWTPEPWILPRKAISDPMISFTVGQGLAHILGESKSIQALGLKQLPNQFCMWAMQHNFPMTYLAFPTPSATNTINQLAQTLPRQAANWMPGHMGEFFWTSNRAEISWRSLPFITPRTYPHVENGNQFVMTEIYPRPPLTNPPPPELFAEIQGKSKLLYYDWEITQERLPHANQLYQLYDIVNNRRPYGTNVTAQRWLISLAPQLGNTITEMSMTGPKEITLVRKSHVGLTSFELVTLARWINSTNFPFEFDPAPSIKRRPPGGKPAANAPQKGTSSAPANSAKPASQPAPLKK